MAQVLFRQLGQIGAKFISQPTQAMGSDMLR